MKISTICNADGTYGNKWFLVVDDGVENNNQSQYVMPDHGKQNSLQSALHYCCHNVRE